MKRSEEGRTVIFASTPEVIEPLIPSHAEDGELLIRWKAARLLRRSEQLMVGQELKPLLPHRLRRPVSNQVVLNVEGLRASEFEDISFKLHKGEILGFGGLSDCSMQTGQGHIQGIGQPAVPSPDDAPHHPYPMP